MQELQKKKKRAEKKPKQFRENTENMNVIRKQKTIV